MSADVIPYYIEINVLTLTLLILITVNINGKTAYFRTENLFKVAVGLTMTAIISDAAATGLEGTMFPGSIAICWVLDCIYFISSILIPYVFLGYIRNLVNRRGFFRDTIMLLTGAPVICFAMLTLSSAVSELIFFIDAENHYHRGPLRPLHGAIGAAILAICFFYALYYHRKNLLPEEISKYIVILPIFPFVGVIIRNHFQGSNMVWTCMTMGLMIIFISGQNSMISVDPLTRLNNKGRCNEYIGMKLENMSEDTILYFTIFDINGFNKINDRFGHLEGDKALKAFSRILKDVCENNRDFIGRFGPDEFVMISERAVGERLDSEIKAISEKLEAHNRTITKYRLSVSRGTALATKEQNLTIAELESMAKEVLQAEKMQFRNGSR